MITVILQLRPAVAACAICLLAGSAAAAEDASRWDGDARSAVRLIAGSRPAGAAAPVRAGIEIRLKPRLAHLLALSGRCRRAAALRLHGIAEREVGRRAVAGAAAAAGRRRRGDRLRPRRDPAARDRAAGPGEAGRAASQARLRDLREAVRAGRGQRPNLRCAAGASSQDAALAAAEARVPKKAALGEGRPLAIRSVRREDGGARPRVVVDVAAPPGVASTCSPRDRRRIGRCRCPPPSTARRPACSASPSSSTARRPGRATRARSSRSPRSRARRRSRSQPVSTNSPDCANLWPACPRGRISGAGEAHNKVQLSARG